MNSFPEVPGQYIVINERTKTIKAVDAIGMRATRGRTGDQILSEINGILEEYGDKRRAAQTMILPDVDDTLIKSALWELGQFVWRGKANVVHGQFPTKDRVLDRDGELIVRHGDADNPYASEEEIARFRATAAKPIVEEAPEVEVSV